MSEVPSHRYPTLGKGNSTATAEEPAKPGETLTAAVKEKAEGTAAVAR